MLALLGVSILIGGVAVAVVDNTRDRDGFLMSAPGQLSSSGYAVTVSALQVSSFGGWAIDAQSTAGTTRITATCSDRPVFIGIGPSDKVAAYLAGVKHDVLEDISTTPFRATYVPVAGGAPSSRARRADVLDGHEHGHGQPAGPHLGDPGRVTGPWS